MYEYIIVHRYPHKSDFRQYMGHCCVSEKNLRKTSNGRIRCLSCRHLLDNVTCRCPVVVCRHVKWKTQNSKDTLNNKILTSNNWCAHWVMNAAQHKRVLGIIHSLIA
ncbi:hypothetical protein CEXT_456761 [Caerostris extrusa]|uniref:Transposase n=1 Tax=Caerostris extrusa TaxID=172846 RepID=A0AAV4W8U7_CAEEX|nr:hypothetical protein CEXT_456761 [Caerostris extrusa]